jgi:hypothetical protein
VSCLDTHTLHLCIVALRFPHKKRGCFTVQGVRGVWVSQKLREKDFEDIDHIIHGRPCLVDDVEADGAAAIDVSVTKPGVNPTPPFECARGHDVQFIDVGMKNPVHEADARTLVRVLIGQLDVDLPRTTFKRCYGTSASFEETVRVIRTLYRTLEPDIELLPVFHQSCWG